MPLRWAPGFEFGPEGDTEAITLAYPAEVFVHGGRTVGSSRRTATGAPYPSIPQRYRTLGLVLRFRDTEWAAVRRMLVWGQTGGSFIWSPNDAANVDQIEEEVEVYLDSPRIQDGFRPERDAVVPWFMRLPIVLCRADSEPWAVEYFKQPPPFIATGGTIVDADGYRAHIFTGSGTFEVLVGESDEVEVLLVAGGGAGGHTTNPSNGFHGGGGGGGGVREVTGLSVEVGEYPVVVGAGGVSNSVAGVVNDGGPSSALGVSSTGGGGGANRTTSGRTGGSGGGGRTTIFSGSNGGAGVVGQGNNGGNGGTVGNAAGGGGAGQVGQNGGTSAGKGGNGISSSFSGAPVTYGGGGGGGGGAVAAGGTGGGGAGARSGVSQAVAGTPNTGGGGGGGSDGSVGTGVGGSGGSGIVIIRYPL